MPCEAQISVPSALTPQTYEGDGVQGAPAVTPRATFGTHSTESQAADASAARGTAVAINPQAMVEIAMTARISPLGDRLPPPRKAYPAGVNSMFNSVSPRRMNVGSYV
jgi:hypothetical protein